MAKSRFYSSVNSLIVMSHLSLFCIQRQVHYWFRICLPLKVSLSLFSKTQEWGSSCFPADNCCSLSFGGFCPYHASLLLKERNLLTVVNHLQSFVIFRAVEWYFFSIKIHWNKLLYKILENLWINCGKLLY